MKDMIRICFRISAANRQREGSVRVPLLLLSLFVVGGILGGYIVSRSVPRPSSPAEVPAIEPSEGYLSEATRAALARLRSPVEIRFYAILTGAGVSDAQKDLGAYVDWLLSEYEREAPDRIKVRRVRSGDAGAQDAASEDGMKPLNSGERRASYLGLAVVRGAQKEVLPQLSPDWKQAVEPDLTRSILRLAETAPAAPGSGSAPEVQAVALEQVKRTISNAGEVSLEEGKRLLREQAMQESQATVQDMESQIKDAQSQLQKALAGGSSAEQAAALKNLQDLQSAKSEKLKDIAAALQDQVSAWEQLKGAPPR